MSQPPQSSNTSRPSSQPLSGHVDSFFERPSDIHDGPDAPATFIQGPLFRQGSNARIAFDQKHEVTIDVVFKLHAPNVEPLSDSVPAKVLNGRRSSAITKAPLVDSKTFNNCDMIEFKACLYGKSLNDLKNLCARLCDVHAPLMEQLLLTSDEAPSIIWKSVVGCTKVVLDGHKGWFDFVELLEKSKKKKGSIMILHEDEVSKAKKNAKVNAAKKAITTAAGPGLGPGTQ